MSLEGKVAIVTGSARGIGKAIALAFAREGADIVVAARSVDESGGLPGSIHKTAEEVRSLGRRALPVRTDVTSEQEVAAMVQAALKEFGRIDILVNNAAAFGQRKPLAETSISEWDEVIAVNLRGTVLCTRAVLPTMIAQKSGCIINITSPQAVNPASVLHISYGVSKAAIDRMTAGLALELKEHNIAVISLDPLYTASERILKNAPDAAQRGAESMEASAKAALFLVTHSPMDFSGQKVVNRDIVEKYGL